MYRPWSVTYYCSVYSQLALYICSPSAAAASVADAGAVATQPEPESAAAVEDDDGIPDFEGEFEVADDDLTFDPARVDEDGKAYVFK